MNLLPVYAAYLCTFGLAAYAKLSAGRVPDWFLKQFGPTFLNMFAGALALNFYFIAALETLAFLAFALSLVRGEFIKGRSKPVLKGALTLAEVLFIILGFGTRLTGDFSTTFQLFAYFAFTFMILKTIE